MRKHSFDQLYYGYYWYIILQSIQYCSKVLWDDWSYLVQALSNWLYYRQLLWKHHVWYLFAKLSACDVSQQLAVIALMKVWVNSPYLLTTPYLLSSETTAKGTGLATTAGKEDPVELDSSLTLWKNMRCRISGRSNPPVKYHYSYRFFTYSVKRSWT